MNRLLLITLTCWLALGPYRVVFGQSGRSTPSPEQLQQWLKQYPKADANEDGVLTIDEADVYRRTVIERARQVQTEDRPEYDFRVEFPYATMSDGVKIALAIGFPKDYDPSAGTQEWPAMLNMMGYPGSRELARRGGVRGRHPTHQPAQRHGRLRDH